MERAPALTSHTVVSSTCFANERKLIDDNERKFHTRDRVIGECVLRHWSCFASEDDTNIEFRLACAAQTRDDSCRERCSYATRVDESSVALASRLSQQRERSFRFTVGLVRLASMWAHINSITWNRIGGCRSSRQRGTSFHCSKHVISTLERDSTLFRFSAPRIRRSPAFSRRSLLSRNLALA